MRLAKLFLLREEALQGTPIAVLVDEVKVVGSFEHVIVSDDVLMAFDVAENVNFVDCALL